MSIRKTDIEQIEDELRGALTKMVGSHAGAIRVLEMSEDEDEIAKTDGENIYLCRRDHAFIREFPAVRLYQHQLRAGLGYHELGHILYTANRTASNFFDNSDAALGMLFPVKNQRASYRRLIVLYGEKAVTHALKQALFQLAFSFHNILEDGHLERRMLEEVKERAQFGIHTPEMARLYRALNFMRLVFKKSLLKQYREKTEKSVFDELVHELLFYSLYGNIEYPTGTGTRATPLKDKNIYLACKSRYTSGYNAVAGSVSAADIIVLPEDTSCITKDIKDAVQAQERVGAIVLEEMDYDNIQRRVENILYANQGISSISSPPPAWIQQLGLMEKIREAVFPKSARRRFKGAMVVAREVFADPVIQLEVCMMIHEALAAQKMSQSGDQGESQDQSRSSDQGKSRDQSQSGDQGKSQDQSQSGDQGKSQDQSQSGDQGKSQDQSQSGDQGKSRDQSQSGDQGESQDQSQSGDQGKSQDQSQSGDQGKSQDQSQSGEKGKSQDQRRSGEKGKSQDQSQSSDQGKSQDQNQSGDQGESQDQSQEKGKDKPEPDYNPVPKELRAQQGVKAETHAKDSLEVQQGDRNICTSTRASTDISAEEIAQNMSEQTPQNETEHEKIVKESGSIVIPPADMLEEAIPESKYAIPRALAESFSRCKQSNVRAKNKYRIGAYSGDEICSRSHEIALAREISEPLIHQVQSLLEQEEFSGKASGSYSGIELDMESVFSPFPCGPFSENNSPAHEIDVAVTILIDNSGSMNGEPICSARRAALAIYQICHALDIPVTVGTYDTDYLHCAAPGFPETHEEVEARISWIDANGGTDDPPYVLWQGNLLIKRPESRKLMFILCDGSPGGNGKAELCAIARYLTANRVELFVAGIGSAKENIKDIYGDNCFLDISNPKELGKELPRILMDSIQSFV